MLSILKKKIRVTYGVNSMGSPDKIMKCMIDSSLDNTTLYTIHSKFYR